MKQPSYKGYVPLPDAIIDAACAGDAEAIDRVLRHYDFQTLSVLPATEESGMFFQFQVYRYREISSL